MGRYLTEIRDMLGVMRDRLDRLMVSRECNIRLEYLEGGIPFIGVGSGDIQSNTDWVEADGQDYTVEG